MRRVVLAITIAAAASMCNAVAANGRNEAANPNPGIVPIQASADGKSYGEWAGDWYNWAFNHGSTNPVADELGVYCAVGQTAKVWFLAGTFGNEALVTRLCTVPNGKHLFVPVLNAFITDDEPGTPAEKKARIKAFIDTGYDFLVRVDGKIVANVAAYRVASQFTLTLTADNVFGAGAAGDYLTYQNGIYLMLNPLTPGPHTVEIFARAAGLDNDGDPGNDGDPYFADPFTVNVMYQLTVAAGPKP